MKYFEISRSAEPDITGMKDGSAQAEIPIEFQDKKFEKISDLSYSFDEFWENLDKLPEFKYVFKCVKLKKKAKATDFLLVAPILPRTFFVSSNAYSILSKFNLAPHKVFDVRLFGHNEGHFANYKFIYFLTLDYSVIDFKESVFSINYNYRKKVKFESRSDFEECHTNEVVNAEILAFNENFDERLDFFAPRPTIAQFFVSERLKKSIEKSMLTGCDLGIPKKPKLRFNK